MSSLLRVIDYAVIGIMLAVSAGIGLYFRFTGGRQKTTLEFLMADRNMGILPVSFSVMATVMSAITLLGSPTEVYYYGAGMIMTDVFFPVGVVIAAYCIVPVYFDTEVNTIYEYLEKRFGKVIKIATSVFFSIQMILYMPVVIYAPSLALSTVTGLSVWTSVVSMALVCTFYSTVGGLKAVLWTDLFQAILMLLTIFALLFKGCMDFGGFYKVLETAYEGHRLDMFNTDIDPTIRQTFWNTMTHGIIAGMFFNGTTFTLIQRLMSCGKLEKAQHCLLWNIPLSILFKVSADVLGILIYSYFHNCDPVQAEGGITSGDQLVPYFILKLFGHLPGLPGFCVAGIFSAALSTMSSVINSLVAVTIEDYIKPYMKCRDLKDSTTAFLAKTLAIFYGGLCLILTFVMANAKGILESAIVLMGIIAGPTLGVFCLGMFTITANEQGALIGLFTGFAINTWIGFGSLYNKSKYPPQPLSTEGCVSYANSSFPQSVYIVNSTWDSEISNFTEVPYLNDTKERSAFLLYNVSYLWITTFSFATTVISGYLASLILGLSIKEKKIDPLQLSPVVRKWICKSTVTRAEKEYIKLSNGTNQTDMKIESSEHNEII